MSPRARDVVDHDDGVAQQQGEPSTKRRRKQHSNKSKKDDDTEEEFALFGESKLTDPQRREIRQSQRALQQTIRDLHCSTLEELAEARETNNDIFVNRVRFTREAVLDAENVNLIASQVAMHVEKQVQVPRFDAIRLVQKLVQKCTNKSSSSSSSQYFDWRLLGTEAGICFNALPERVTFLAGALDQDVALKKKVIRKPREKAVADTSAEIQPETVTNTTDGKKEAADKLSAMEKAVGTMRTKLLKRTEEETVKATGPLYANPDIDGVKFLFNPKSFTQTVENIFNFSFLIKGGHAEIGVRSSTNNGGIGDSQNSTNGADTNNEDNSSGGNGLYVALRKINSDLGLPTTQAVCSFTMADWRRLVAQQNLEKGDLPHRTGSKPVTTAMSQLSQ